MIELARSNALPQPVALSPSDQWDGFDGPWSTFTLGIGSNEVTTVRCLPVMSRSFMFVPSNSTCTPDQCRESNTFNTNTSESWQEQGNFTLPTDYIVPPGFPGGRTKFSVGLNVITIGSPAAEALTLENEYIALADPQDIPIGLFSLSDTSYDPGVSVAHSLIMTLAGSKSISSASFSYTAGSIAKDVPGSLVLGGYDGSRFDPKTMMQLDLQTKSNRNVSYTTPVLIHVDSISIDEASWHGNSSSTFAIDFTTPFLWLPPEACRVFEKTFHLKWDKDAHVYLLDDTTHKSNLQLNKNVTFAIRSPANITSKKHDFTLTYSALALKLASPQLPNDVPGSNSQPSRYFPLRSSLNPGRYIFGRVFLQETYLTVNYDDWTFNLSQAVVATKLKPDIRPIGQLKDFPSPTKTPTPSPSSSLSPPDSSANANGQHATTKRLSSGAIAGLTVSVASVIIALIALYFKKRLRSFFTKPENQRATSPERTIEKPELEDTRTHSEIMPGERRELGVGHNITELQSDENPAELPGSVPQHELPTNTSEEKGGKDGREKSYGDSIGL